MTAFLLYVLDALHGLVAALPSLYAIILARCFQGCRTAASTARQQPAPITLLGVRFSPLVDVTDIPFDVMPLFCKFRAKSCLQEQDSHEEQQKNHGGGEDTLSDNALKTVFVRGSTPVSPWLLLEGGAGISVTNAASSADFEMVHGFLCDFQMVPEATTKHDRAEIKSKSKW